jgi:glycerol-3-phosphate dehydrogenase
MPPVDKPAHEKYDYVVIGGGSGGSGTSVSSPARWERA